MLFLVQVVQHRFMSAKQIYLGLVEALGEADARRQALDRFPARMLPNTYITVAAVGEFLEVEEPTFPSNEPD